ncbi:SRPBCC domain-containing protein [Streptomyces sp. NPDC102274]|uniref:SRPBCC family protein n=1 Tax=Streptomyces sp. NPDC102274 TaxID=3366151 RepID=UPI003824C98F
MSTTDPKVIRCDQFIAHPPAAVWRALTDPELHARWWAAGDVRPVVGHRFTLDMGPWGQQWCDQISVDVLPAMAEGPRTADTLLVTAVRHAVSA